MVIYPKLDLKLPPSLAQSADENVNYMSCVIVNSPDTGAAAVSVGT